MERVPMNVFAERIEHASAAWGDRPYLLPADGSDTSDTGEPAEGLSFRAFGERVRRVAGGLSAAGVRPGDRVCLLIDNRPDFVVGWFACQLVGCTAAATNFTLPADSQRHLIEVVRPRVCLSVEPSPSAEATAIFGAAGVPVLDLAALAESSGPLEQPAEVDEAHPSQIVFSSGTTGRPKAAIQTAGHLVGLLTTAERIGLTSRDRLMITSPMFHGLAQSWFQYGLELGLPVVVAPRFSATRFWADCRRFEITAVQHVGAILSFLLKAPPAADDRDHAVRLTFGVGAPPAVWAAFEERFGIEVVEFYGMTEVGLVAFNGRPAKVGSVGRPAALEVRLVDEHGVDVPVGSVGEAWTRPAGPGSARPQYYGDAAATAAAETEDGWFRTGDLLRRDAEGYLYFAGRRKESLRRRGENIVPEDLERQVVRLPEIDQCAAIAVPSEHGDDDIRLCLIPTAPGTPTDAEVRDLAERIRAVLPATMQPRFLSFHDHFPTTATNKLQRLRLGGTDHPCWDVEHARWTTTAPQEATA